MKKVLLFGFYEGSDGVPLSTEALDEILNETGIDLTKLPYEVRDGGIIKRDSPVLINVVEKLKGEAFDSVSKWRIVEIPDDMKFGIAFRYDGKEILYDTSTAIEPDFSD